jgi:hypothetical protein
LDIFVALKVRPVTALGAPPKAQILGMESFFIKPCKGGLIGKSGRIVDASFI